MEGSKDRSMKWNILKNEILLILILLLPLTGMAQDVEGFKKRVYDSYAGGNMTQWRSALNEMEEIYEKTGDKRLLHELLLAQYGYIGFCIKEERKKEASYHLDRAKANLEKLQAIYPGKAEYLAFEGALLGYEMGIHKIKAMILGPKAKEKIDAAVETDPGSVRTMLEKANQLNFSPKIVGGDKEKAIEYYRRVIDKIESDPGLYKENWIYVNTLIVLARVYEEMDNDIYACAIYEKIMDYDPGIKWVKNDLYAGCENRSDRTR